MKSSRFWRMKSGTAGAGMWSALGAVRLAIQTVEERLFGIAAEAV